MMREVRTAPIWLLAMLPPLFSAGNFVLARALHADIPPIALSFWRWTIALTILLPFVAAGLWRQRDLIRRHWALLTLFAIVAIGLPPLAVLYAWELSTGPGFAIHAVNLVAIGYVALFPSVLAYFFWNRAVAEMGPNRTGQYMHLMPVFAAGLAILLLGERLQAFHVAGALLIAAGIVLAARGFRTAG
ncbi:MAG: DMT family transporter [Thioalkalivibrio sp.]|nr:DMT family transporter [Thioalkalivibrio sp.]